MHSTCALLFQNLNMGGGQGSDADAAGKDDGKFNNPAIYSNPLLQNFCVGTGFEF